MLLLSVSLLAISEESVPVSGEYETPGPVNAEDFLPKSAFTAKKLFVEKTAQNDGLQNTYRIRSGAGEYEVTGSMVAMQLLQELRAINELSQISTAKAFARGLKQSAKGTYERWPPFYFRGARAAGVPAALCCPRRRQIHDAAEKTTSNGS
jgi:hypothetical protein